MSSRHRKTPVRLLWGFPNLYVSLAVGFESMLPSRYEFAIGKTLRGRESTPLGWQERAPTAEYSDMLCGFVTLRLQRARWR